MVYVASCIGVHHQICEDAVLVGMNVFSDTTKTMNVPVEGFICIADGVGGHNGGAVASRYVLEALASASNHDELKDALIKINQSLIDHAKKTPDAFNMATTLTGILCHGETYQLFHIGNTRAFIKQGRYLKQITSDHTTYNWLKSRGDEEAAANCDRSEITNCFGGGNPEFLSKLTISKLAPYSMIVFTSDGIHDYVDIDTLEDILFGEGTYEDKCETIMNKAKVNGSEDDMTIIISIPNE